MPKTYSQLVRQIESLKRQAGEIRKKEIGGVIARIKAAIVFYELTSADLGFGVEGKDKAKTPIKSVAKYVAAVKYTDGAGNSWTGRGPKPRWLKDALAKGKRLEDLSSATAPSSKAQSKAKPAKKKGVSTIKYRDDAGHAWTGRGPKPRWLNDAIAKGKTLKDLAA